MVKNIRREFFSLLQMKCYGMLSAIYTHESEVLGPDPKFRRPPQIKDARVQEI